jgi:hypothetical protein
MLLKNTLLTLLFTFVFSKANSQIFKNGSYVPNVSPLLGLSHWTKTSIDVGVCTEFYHGKDVWQPSPIRFCNLFTQCVGAEILLQQKVRVIPKYSFWFHSTKLFVFSVGSSFLYTPENRVFMRPEFGLVLPKEKMQSLFGIRYLRFKLAYGYNISFSGNALPFDNNNISLVVYFGNNIGNYKAMK